MTPGLLHDLRSRRTAIRMQWETLLRTEPVRGPLSNPDTLVFLIPESLDQIFSTLAKGPPTPPAKLPTQSQPLACDCGNNPYLAYFIAGEQALVEALVLLQAELLPDGSEKRDVSEIMLTVRQLARSEIDTFCSICVHRGTAPHCRHAVAAG